MQSDHTDCRTALTADTRGPDDNSSERHNVEVRHTNRLGTGTLHANQAMLRVDIIDPDVGNAFVTDHVGWSTALHDFNKGQHLFCSKLRTTVFGRYVYGVSSKRWK